MKKSHTHNAMYLFRQQFFPFLYRSEELHLNTMFFQKYGSHIISAACNQLNHKDIPQLKKRNLKRKPY